MEDKLEGGRLFVEVAGRQIEVPKHPSVACDTHSKGRFTHGSYTSGFVDEAPSPAADGP